MRKCNCWLENEYCKCEEEKSKEEKEVRKTVPEQQGVRTVRKKDRI